MRRFTLELLLGRLKKDRVTVIQMKSTFVSVFVLVALLFISCGKDDKQITSSSTALDISALAGVWDLEVLEYSLASDTSQKIDWVITRGLSGTWTISDNGDFTDIFIIGIDTSFGAGTLTLSASVGTIYFNGNDNDTARFELNIPMLTLFSFEAHLVDIDLDGNPENVFLKSVYRRR